MRKRNRKKPCDSLSSHVRRDNYLLSSSGTASERRGNNGTHRGVLSSTAYGFHVLELRHIQLIHIPRGTAPQNPSLTQDSNHRADPHGSLCCQGGGGGHTGNLRSLTVNDFLYHCTGESQVNRLEKKEKKNTPRWALHPCVLSCFSAMQWLLD